MTIFLNSPKAGAFRAAEEITEWPIEEIPVENVLVIHDDRHLSKFLPMYFSKIGIQAFYSDNVQDGHEKFLEEAVDIIFADIGVYGIWTWVCHIKEQYPDKPVILMMDQRGEYYLESIEEKGINSVLIKPFGLNAMKNKIRELYDTVQ